MMQILSRNGFLDLMFLEAHRIFGLPGPDFSISMQNSASARTRRNPTTQLLHQLQRGSAKCLLVQNRSAIVEHKPVFQLQDAVWLSCDRLVRT